MIRADLRLTELGLAPSRTAAQQYIAAGRVYLIEANQRIPLTKPSQKLLADALLEVEPHPADRFVSRGGLKLAGALSHARLDVTGWRCLDVGISTGGFADCLLQAGATSVVGVEVGHGQLHPRLAADPRVQQFEGVNARALDIAAIQAANGGSGFDLAVADVSFISLTLVLPAFATLVIPGGQFLLLVKPQFEVGRGNIAKGGIVRDTALYAEVRTKVETAATELGLHCIDWFASPIEGGDGNREFFLQLTRP
ncbi:TlyA family rRNA (cytidine-2'-O)-methyltransferase [Chitinimonas sp. BJB300]|nr:TlyA family rRNA (cytidine-2'-O)-methyltransferase [Chitinimonas sp. BJB300]TSJ91645.1 TlyA family RNA methyltransferase [Chitinimonas sp. BJB300]